METLLNKRGGYLSNDVMPPSLWLDNIPNWEFGVLVQCRDIARSLRNDLSRSQSQSVEDEDLIIAEPLFHFDNASWLFPATESEYQKGLDALHRYLNRLQNPNNPEAQFFARADNLSDWLGQVEKRLGSLSQRLSASVGQTRINTDLAGDSAAEQSTRTARELEIKTPWTEIDDVFYEARGSTWVLIHFLKAMEVDFYDVLRKKNAQVSFRQIIRGKIKDNLRKYISQGEMIARKGKNQVSIPLPQVDIPRFKHGSKQQGGVGQGDGQVGAAHLHPEDDAGFFLEF